MLQNGLGIDDPGSNPNAGTQMIVWSKNGGTNQQWGFTSNSDGTFLLENVSSRLCADDAGNSQSSGTAIIQWYCTDNLNQRWSLVASGSGYLMKNASSGLYVTIPATGNPPQLIQQTAGAPQQTSDSHPGRVISPTARGLRLDQLVQPQAASPTREAAAQTRIGRLARPPTCDCARRFPGRRAASPRSPGLCARVVYLVAEQSIETLLDFARVDWLSFTYKHKRPS